MLFNIIIIRLTCYWIFAKSKCKCMAMSFCSSREISSFQNCPIVIILLLQEKYTTSSHFIPKKPSFFSSKYPLTGKYHYEYVKLCVVKFCWVNFKAFVSFPLCSLEVKMIWSIPGETMKKNLAALRTRSAQLMHDGWPAEEVIRRATCQRNTHSIKTYACPLKELTLISRTKEVLFSVLFNPQQTHF